MTVRRAVVFLAIAQTINWASLYYIFAALLIRWQEVDGWSKTILTAAFTGAIIMSAIVAPFAGRLVDRGLGPQILCGSAFIGACLVGLLPVSETIWVFGILWLGIGACLGGCLYETCFAFITRTRGDSARRDITLVALFAGFASTLSFPICHAISEALGWSYALWTLSAMVIGIAIPLTWVASRYLEARSGAPIDRHDQKTAKDADDTQKPTVPLTRRPVFWLLAIGFALLGANHGVVVNHLLLILHDRGVHGDAAVLTASMMGPMQVAGRLAMMSVERHVSNHTIATACFVALLCASVSLYWSSSIASLLVAFVILQGSGHGVTSIMRPVIVREVLGARNFGAKSGAVAVPFLVLWALSPFVGSLIWEVGGYDLVLVSIAGFAFIGLCSYRAAARLSR